VNFKLDTSKEGVRKLALRILIYFLSACVGACATALLNFNALGSNAMNTLFMAVAKKLDVLPGLIYTTFNGTFLVVGFLLARRYMGVGSILMLFTQGPLIDLFTVFFSQHPQLFEGPVNRAAVGVLSFFLYSFGLALGASMCFGIAGYEACLFALADRVRVEYKVLKTCSEVLYFVAAYLLGGVYGVMTVAQVLLHGSVFSWFVVQMNRHWWTPLGIANEKNELDRNKRRLLFAKKAQ